MLTQTWEKRRQTRMWIIPLSELKHNICPALCLLHFAFVHFEFFEAERAVRPHFNRWYSISKCSSRSQILTPPFTGRRLQSATVVGTDVDTQLSIKFISEAKFKQGSVKTSKSLTGVFNSFKMSKSGLLSICCSKYRLLFNYFHFSTCIRVGTVIFVTLISTRVRAELK